MKKKKIISLMLVASIFANSQTAFTQYINMELTYDGQTHEYSADEVKIMIDGEELIPEDMPPIIIDGFTMLPMRLIVEALGGEAVWNEETQQAFAVTEDIVASFTVGSDEAFMNEESVIMSAPAMIINARTMLPVRGVAETLGLEIDWDNETRTVYIGEREEVDLEDLLEDIPDLEEEEGQEEVETEDELEEEFEPEEEVEIISTCNIESIKMPYGTGDVQVFRITSDEVITNFEEITSDENSKIIIDIHSATNDLESEYTLTNSNLVSAIRVGNHTDEDVARTRVVFDMMTEEAPYEIYSSYDGKEIIVSFGEINMIDMVAVYDTEADADIVTITSDGTSGAVTNYMRDVSTFVLTIENVGDGLIKSLDPFPLRYIDNISSVMLNDKTMQVSIQVSQNYAFNVVDEFGKLTVTIKDSGIESIEFDEETSTLKLNGSLNFDVNDVEIFDNYNDDYTEIQFKDYSISDFNMSKIEIDNELTDSIEFSSNGLGSVIRFNQNYYSGYIIRPCDTGYEILIKKPKDAYDKVIMIDAGHGGQDGGTTGNGLLEKELNLSLVLKIEKHLEGSGIHVYQTRSDDTYPALSWRSPTATDIAHIMLSVHHNAATSSTANGTETFYMVNDNEKDPASNQLTSYRLAETIQDAILKAISTTNRGVKSNPAYIILNQSEIPTVLTEIGFLTNYGDALKVSSDANQEIIAKNIADGIIDLFNNYEPPK